MENQKPSLVEVLVTLPFTAEQTEALREVSPRLRIAVQPVRKPEEISSETWARAEVLYTDRVFPTPEQAPKLRWIQSHFAGLDALLEAPIFQKPDLMVTSLSGVAAPQMAEYALTMMLALGHRLPELGQAQAKTDWPRDRYDRFRPVELRNSTVGIVGYGSVGREIARLARSFGATILATKRDVMKPDDAGYTVPGLGDVSGDFFHRLYPPQAVRSMMKESDFVVVAVPLTPETRGMIGAADLAAMKSTAYLVVMARGGVVDQQALVNILQERKIAGAALDVFQEEPLPTNSVLWRMNNVFISPHIAGVSTRYNDRAIDLFIENIKRYLTGAPLLNRLDLEKGY